ncbi:AAWKG family protein [Streptomyces sp.]|uniref:AAWKG family protein n=1 Tax=Streptomyces sp. TaxID=1931 RepID=UPI002F4094E9
MAVDNWEHIINLMTGWTLPERSAVTGAKGDSGIPWMNVKIHRIGLDDSPTNSLHDMGATFQFYTGSGGSVDMYQADVNYVGLDQAKQYWERSEFALWHLVFNNFQTTGLYAPVGGAPTGTNGVDLHDFAKRARSFDAAGDFFAQHTQTLKQWLDALGSEQAAWKGKAAGVFWHLLDDLHNKYENFTAQLRPPGFQPSSASPSTGYQSSTLHGDSLIGAEVALHGGLRQLYQTYENFFWQRGTPISITRANGSGDSQQAPADPRDILNQIMADIAQWIQQYNWSQVTVTTGGSGYMGNPTAPLWEASASFSSSPAWGNLQDTSTWSAIANEAVRRWTSNVEANLDTPSHPVVSQLQQSWVRVMDPGWNTKFAFEDTSRRSLDTELQQEITEVKQKELGDQGKNFQDSLNNFGKNIGDFGKNIGDFGKNMGEFGNNLGKNMGEFGNNIGEFGNNLGKNLSEFGSNLGGGPPPPAFTANPSGSNNFGSLGGTHGLPDLTGTQGTSFTTNPAGLNNFGGLDGGTHGLPGLTGGIRNPDGSITTTGPGGLPLTTFPNGSTLTTLPGGLTQLTNPNGSVSTRNPDGSVTTTFPNGTKTTVNPDGTVTTTTPDGKTTTSHLSPGEELPNPDGGTSTIGPDGTVTTHFPDGSSFTSNPDGSFTTTNPDGSHTTTFPNGSVQTVGPDGQTHLTQPNGTVSTPDAHGGVTTTFPDGTRTTVNPDGTVTTISPDGHTTTSHLGAGEVLTNPDGSTTTITPGGGVSTHFPDGSSFTSNPDGSFTTTNPDGSHSTTFQNGMVETVGSDGQMHLTSPNGSVTTQNPDGSLTTQFPQGGSTTVNPNGDVTTTTADGRTITSHLDPGQSLVNPDGSTTTIGTDGAVTTRFPDGSSYTVNPDGTVTTTNPTVGSGSNGLPHPITSSGPDFHLPEYHTPDLSGIKHDLPNSLATHNPDGSLTSHFPSGTTSTVGADGFTRTNFPDGSSTVSGPDGQFQALPSPATAAAGAPGAAPGGAPGAALGGAGGPDAGLLGLMSPMMMMMGMARSGQGGQQNNEQERIRDTYEEADDDGAFIRHAGVLQPPAPVEESYEDEEEDAEELLGRTVTASEPGYGRPGTPRPATQSANSARTAREDDVWGTEEGGLPASIGR